jgi:hypothetical protein
VLKTPDKITESKQVIAYGFVRVRGKSYKIREIQYSILNPQAPPVVVVRREEEQPK